MVTSIYVLWNHLVSVCARFCEILFHWFYLVRSTFPLKSLFNIYSCKVNKHVLRHIYIVDDFNFSSLTITHDSIYYQVTIVIWQITVITIRPNIDTTGGILSDKQIIFDTIACIWPLVAFACCEKSILTTQTNVSIYCSFVHFSIIWWKYLR
jgi:hypothetical protein